MRLLVKKLFDNKLFWETVKPSLSKKISAKGRISLSENGEIEKTEKGTTEVSNKFFGNIVKNLNISQYSNFDPIIENVKYPTLKAVLKYKNTLSFMKSELNVIGIVFLILGRSFLRNLEQILGY